MCRASQRLRPRLLCDISLCSSYRCHECGPAMSRRRTPAAYVAAVRAKSCHTSHLVTPMFCRRICGLVISDRPSRVRSSRARSTHCPTCLSASLARPPPAPSRGSGSRTLAWAASSRNPLATPWGLTKRQRTPIVGTTQTSSGRLHEVRQLITDVGCAAQRHFSTTPRSGA